MNVYNTGKVKIGIAHERYQKYVPTDDMAKLQRALIDPPKRGEKLLDYTLAIALGVAFAWFLVVAAS